MVGHTQELCERVAFVVDGRIADMDTPAEHKIGRSNRTVHVTCIRSEH